MFWENKQQRLEDLLRTTFEETLREVRQAMREQIPAQRTKTRQALRYRVFRIAEGYRGEIALKFSERYPVDGTETERQFQRAWTRARSSFLPLLRQRISEHIGSI